MLISSIIGIILCILALKIIGAASKTIIKLIVNSLVGLIVLYFINSFGIMIEPNWMNAFLVGFFGLPAVIILAII